MFSGNFFWIEEVNYFFFLIIIDSRSFHESSCLHESSSLSSNEGALAVLFGGFFVDPHASIMEVLLVFDGR